MSNGGIGPPSHGREIGYLDLGISKATLKMTNRSPLWIAPRTGQDWVCDDTKRAVEWLKSFVPEVDMAKRLQNCQQIYLGNRERWEDGQDVEIFDKKDEMAWFIFQAETYAIGREFWVPDEAARIVP